jgi:hypothetical protein
MTSAKDALATTKANPHDRWSGGEGSAEERINSRIIVPVGRQSFTAKPSDKFFAIGSCFARNVEERLEQAGATVTSRQIAVRDLGNASAREGGVFNKYTPVSILQELKWAAGIEAYPEEALLPLGVDNYYDPYLSGKAGRGPGDELMARREEVGQYFAQIFQADVAILTLGLIESWTDLETGLSLNEAPNPKILMRHSGRFAFEQLSFEQCEAALAEIAEILKAHGKPGQKKVVTVSPVPLGRTFTSDDIVVANATSKSTLRTAAMRLVSQNDDIDYFPSYEAVMHSDPNLSWQRDRRHVSDVVVGRIIQTFLLRYGVTTQEPEPLEEMLDALRNDPTFQKWADKAEDQEALMARLNQEVNKYKNMVIALQKELRQANA